MNQILAAELEGISLGDQRLNKRAIKIADRLQANSMASFPKIFPESAELEGFYRFVENPQINGELLLKPHIEATVRRVEKAGDVVVAHDTTEFCFSGSRENLSPSQKPRKVSFFGHLSFAFSKENAQPLGTLGLKTWFRSGPTKSSLRRQGVSRIGLQDDPSEQDRWGESVFKTAALFKSNASLIHVCDSESDDYQVYAQLVSEYHRFVIRGCQNRKTTGTKGKILLDIASEPVIAERSVPVSKRDKPPSKKNRTKKNKRHLPRPSRTAELEIRCSKITLIRPKLLKKSIPKNLTLNVVQVKERNTPENMEPIEWTLLTSEPISTVEEVLSIIDIYRMRWGIEEFFKALKTGCAFEKRQLESYHTLSNCLALLVPIAWLILSLRFASRTKPDILSEQVLPEVLLKVLRLETNTPVETARDALLAIAKIGGHIKNNGPPGWLVLWRGFHELGLLVRGFLLAQKDVINDET